MRSAVFDVFIIIFVKSVLIRFVNSQIPIQDKDAVILEQEYVPNERGYTFRYRTSDGIERSEQGTFDGPDMTLKVEGQYRYPIGDQIYEVFYTADEKGYVAHQSVTKQVSQQKQKKPPMKTLPGLIEISPGVFVGRNRIGGATVASLVGGGLG